MSRTRSFHRSFAGGEVTPEFFGRVDDVKNAIGLQKCRNFEILPHGPARNCPGTKFVKAAKYANKTTRVIPFYYADDQTFAIEIGEGYFRFHTAGATLLTGTPDAYDNTATYAPGDLVLSGGFNYYCVETTTGNVPPNATYWYAMPADGTFEVPNNYNQTALMDLRYVQSEDVLTFTHPDYPPMELRRYGATRWTFVRTVFGSILSAPANIAATPTNPGATNYTYTVTALDEKGSEESLPGTEVTEGSDALSSTVTIAVTWDAVSGAARYNIYKQDNGIFGYIGQTDQLTFTDNNIAADVSRTPPIAQDPFNTTDKYPRAVSYFDQRKVFGGTNTNRRNIAMTRVGSESNMSFSIPNRDTDAISFNIWARDSNTIRHFVPLNDLLVLTSSAAWMVTSVNSDSITPTSIAVRPQAYAGASNAQPVVVDNIVVYGAARGGHVRALGYSAERGSYVSRDLCLRAPHLFDNLDVLDLAYTQAPFPFVYAVSSDGRLRGMTFIPEQEVEAWWTRDSYTAAGQSNFKSVCAVVEEKEDVVYCVVEREINGATVQYIEYIASRQFAQAQDAYFVDCGVTYDGAPITTISSGLDHLEGETVSILADGAVFTQQVVTGGEITLDAEASVVHVGLPIEADLQTLPLAYEGPAFGQGRAKNTNKAWLRVAESSGIFAGPSFDNLREVKQRTTEPYGTPPDLRSTEFGLTLTPGWGTDGAVCVRQSNPLPLTLVSLTTEVSLGA